MRLTIDIERVAGGEWVATLGKESVRAPTKWGAIRALIDKHAESETPPPPQSPPGTA